MSMTASAAHLLIRASALANARRFHRHRRAAARVQQSVLLDILRQNKDSIFGQQHRFAAVTSVAAYRELVPVRTWEQFAPLVREMRATGRPVLTAALPTVYQPTSGTSQFIKLIPCTPALTREFSVAVSVWLSDLYHRYPGIRRGRHYWSISPPSSQQAGGSAGDASVGFADDTEYLGLRGAIMRSAMAVPPAVRRSVTMDAFLVSTVAHLAAAGDLSLISVWNPTFLTVLLDTLLARADDVLAQLPALGTPRRRIRMVESALARHSSPSPALTTSLWPGLALLSCWADGASAGPAQRLHSLFPHAAMQPKGLCATEGIVAIPFGDGNAAVPAYMSHFLEFLPADGGPARGVEELDAGGAYGVVLTTGGGLYRYALGDIVRVTGHRDGLPTLVFVCRDRVCDMVGEKLHEQAVASSVDQVLADEGITAGFRMVAPEQIDGVFRYALFVHLPPQPGDPGATASRLAEALDLRLRRNFHYDYARNLGQLLPCAVVPLGADAERAYVDRLLTQGMRAGDIKPVILDRRLDWRTWFAPRIARESACV